MKILNRRKKLEKAMKKGKISKINEKNVITIVKPEDAPAPRVYMEGEEKELILMLFFALGIVARTLKESGNEKEKIKKRFQTLFKLVFEEI